MWATAEFPTRAASTSPKRQPLGQEPDAVERLIKMASKESGTKANGTDLLLAVRRNRNHHVMMQVRRIHLGTEPRYRAGEESNDPLVAALRTAPLETVWKAATLKKHFETFAQHAASAVDDDACEAEPPDVCADLASALPAIEEVPAVEAARKTAPRPQSADTGRPSERGRLIPAPTLPPIVSDDRKSTCRPPRAVARVLAPPEPEAAYDDDDGAFDADDAIAEATFDSGGCGDGSGSSDQPPSPEVPDGPAAAPPRQRERLLESRVEAARAALAESQRALAAQHAAAATARLSPPARANGAKDSDSVGAGYGRAAESKVTHADRERRALLNSILRVERRFEEGDAATVTQLVQLAVRLAATIDNQHAPRAASTSAAKAKWKKKAFVAQKIVLTPQRPAADAAAPRHDAADASLASPFAIVSPLVTNSAAEFLDLAFDAGSLDLDGDESSQLSCALVHCETPRQVAAPPIAQPNAALQNGAHPNGAPPNGAPPNGAPQNAAPPPRAAPVDDVSSMGDFDGFYDGEYDPAPPAAGPPPTKLGGAAPTAGGAAPPAPTRNPRADAPPCAPIVIDGGETSLPAHHPAAAADSDSDDSRDGPELLHADVSRRDLGDVGVSALCVGIATPTGATHLGVLNLSHNAIGCAGVKVLCSLLFDAARGSFSCTSLDLSHNAVGDAGAVALAGVLRAPGALRHLDLSDNGAGAPDGLRSGLIGSAGLEALFGALRSSKLRTLRLRRSVADGCDSALNVLAESLSANARLRELDVGAADFSAAVLAAFAATLAQRRDAKTAGTRTPRDARDGRRTPTADRGAAAPAGDVRRRPPDRYPSDGHRHDHGRAPEGRELRRDALPAHYLDAWFLAPPFAGGHSYTADPRGGGRFYDADPRGGRGDETPDARDGRAYEDDAVYGRNPHSATVERRMRALNSHLDHLDYDIRDRRFSRPSPGDHIHAAPGRPDGAPASARRPSRDFSQATAQSWFSPGRRDPPYAGM